MERTISVRSLVTDRKRNELIALGREKEKELLKAEIIHSLLFSDLVIAPSLEGGKLGYFSPSDRLIVLSEEAVRGTDDETVRNIFLHELSHALDLMLSGTLTGHSSSFRRCCQLLGVSPGFEKSHVKTAVRVFEERRDKIKKLLALSSSPFENEAQEAIKKAKELMAKAGIKDEEDERIYMVPLYAAKRYLFSTRVLLNYVASVTGVYIVISQERDGTKTAIAYGSLEETEASIYLYDYITSSAEREIRKMRRDGIRIEKDSFIRGIVNVLSQHTADSTADNALILIQNNNKNLAKKIVFQSVRITESAVRTYSWNPESFEKGKGFGSKLSIPSRIERKELK